MVKGLTKYVAAVMAAGVMGMTGCTSIATNMSAINGIRKVSVVRPEFIRQNQELSTLTGKDKPDMFRGGRTLDGIIGSPEENGIIDLTNVLVRKDSEGNIFEHDRVTFPVSADLVDELGLKASFKFAVNKRIGEKYADKDGKDWVGYPLPLEISDTLPSGAKFDKSEGYRIIMELPNMGLVPGGEGYVLWRDGVVPKSRSGNLLKEVSNVDKEMYLEQMALSPVAIQQAAYDPANGSMMMFLNTSNTNISILDAPWGKKVDMYKGYIGIPDATGSNTNTSKSTSSGQQENQGDRPD